MRGLIHKKSETRTRHKLPIIPENRNLSKRLLFLCCLSEKSHRCETQHLQNKLLSFALHPRTPGLNKQTLEWEWTAQYTGSDSHPWCVPADGCGILPGINLTLGSWKMKQQLSFLGSSSHCSWDCFSWRLCWVQTRRRILHNANVTEAGGKMAPGQVACEGRSHF